MIPLCLSLDQKKCDGSGFLCLKAGKIHKEIGSGCQEDLTIYGQFTGAVTATYRDTDQTFSSVGLVTTSIKVIDGIIEGKSILKRMWLLTIFLKKPKNLHILNFVWLTPVNKELIQKDLKSFSMSEASTK